VQVARSPGGRRAVVDVSEVVLGPERVRRLADGDRVLAMPQRSRLAGVVGP
jgi:hypothetical protein